MSGRIFRNLSGKLLSHYRQRKKIVGCGDSLLSKALEDILWDLQDIENAIAKLSLSEKDSKILEVIHNVQSHVCEGICEIEQYNEEE